MRILPGMAFIRPPLLLLPLLALAACSPSDSYERVQRSRSFEGERALPRDEDSLREVVADSVNTEDVLKLVKRYPAPQSDHDTETWLTKKLHDDPGRVMFPRWEVLRRGSSKYEARFTYTYIGEDNRMVKRGLTWNVDTVLKVVSPPRDLQDEAARTRGMRVESDAGERRIRKAESALE